MSGYIGDEYVSETMTSTDWLAEYIGIAKERNVSGSDTETIELTDINFAPPISANFSAAPIDGLTPLSVSFNDESIGYINNWSWDFGDGSTSTNQHPSHTYINPDTYTISLTVTGLGGSDTETKTDYVIVKEHVSMPWIPLLLLDD
jgi:PKD repeat protein